MSISETKAGDRIMDVRLSCDTMSVDLEDGRTIKVPLTLYPKLLHATAYQRNRWELSGAGFGIYWPELDEDLSVEGLIHGVPSAGRGCAGSETSPSGHKTTR